MSGGNDLLVWVSDIDDYVDIEAINDEYLRDEELRAIGEIGLFAGRAVSASTLDTRGVSPAAWRWALHKAKTSLADASGQALESHLVKSLISLGRRYAVARYARWEQLSYSSAMTSTLHHGMRALLEQFFDREPLINIYQHRSVIWESLREAADTTSLTAYERAGLIREVIHRSARHSLRPDAHLSLDRDSMRTILSLCRLHFSIIETNVSSLSDLHRVNTLYDNARMKVLAGKDADQNITSHPIKNWQLRHLHPLTFLYPYAIRNTIKRGIRHVVEDAAPLTRSIAVNELALAHCGIALMRQKARGRSRSQ